MTSSGEVMVKAEGLRKSYGTVEAVRGVLERLGASEPAAAAEALMAVSEGLILHRIARHDASDPRPAIAIAVRGALG